MHSDRKIIDDKMGPKEDDKRADYGRESGYSRQKTAQ